MWIVPLPVILPLLTAALLAVTAPLHSRRFEDLVGIATSIAVGALCAVLLAWSTHRILVYWYGGWAPRHSVALGISFAIEPLGAGLALLIALLMTCSFVFSWRYFAAVDAYFHILMLVALAAMVGFCLSGDLFNMFVFFELVSITAFILTGYLAEDRGPLQGAINYTVIASIAAFLILNGLALLYARTGALNLAQIGHALAGRPPDGLVIVSFVLILSGFLAKAAIAPFHFWLPDVETVAPNPVCVIFSGGVVPLGVLGMARVYWTVFAAPLAVDGAALRAILVVAGTVTALLGAVMSLREHHLKRLLAFSSMAHAGLFLIGFGLLTPLGLAGCALYLLAHSLVKGSLFLSTGIVYHCLDEYSIHKLRGRARRLRWTGVLFTLGGLALAALPPFGTYLGKGLIEDAAGTGGATWLVAVLFITSACTGGAVLRAAAVVFLGWGSPGEDQTGARASRPHERESEGSLRTPAAVMIAPAAVLLLAALLVGLIPHLGHAVETAAVAFQDRRWYAAAVLHALTRMPRAAGLEPARPNASMVFSGLGSALTAIGLAATLLFYRHLAAPVRDTARRLSAWPLARLDSLQSGHVGDYAAWLVCGVAIIGAVCGLAFR